jgi:hypothetical protein
MELRPGAPWHEDIRILFAVVPPGAALLIAVLEGPEAVQEQYPEAVMASADMLRRVRAGRAPDRVSHAARCEEAQECQYGPFKHQRVDIGQSRTPEGNTVATVCCCRRQGYR